MANGDPFYGMNGYGPGYSGYQREPYLRPYPPKPAQNFARVGRFEVQNPALQTVPKTTTVPGTPPEPVPFKKRTVKTIYVAGPMRGYDKFNFPAFDAERDRLIGLGYKVISPADMDREHGDTDIEAMTCPPIEDCMRRDIAALLEVDAIRFLPGWEASQGAKIEETVGKALGLTLWYPDMRVPFTWDAWVEKFSNAYFWDPKRYEANHESDAVDAWHRMITALPKKKMSAIDFNTIRISDPMAHVVKETPLQEAQRLVHSDRGNDYGHPLDDFDRTGKIWGAILEDWRDSDEERVPPELVGLCMVGVKISREVNKPKRDNRVDGAGYFETVDMVHEERARRDLEDA